MISYVKHGKCESQRSRTIIIIISSFLPSATVNLLLFYVVNCIQWNVSHTISILFWGEPLMHRKFILYFSFGFSLYPWFWFFFFLLKFRIKREKNIWNTPSIQRESATLCVGGHSIFVHISSCMMKIMENSHTQLNHLNCLIETEKKNWETKSTSTKCFTSSFFGYHQL